MDKKKSFSILNYQCVRTAVFSIADAQRGFSLVELIIAIAVIGILTVVLSAIIVTSQRSAAVERTRADLVTENRLLIDETSRNIKSARSVLASATILASSYTTGGETLILELPAVDANQTIITSVFDTQVWRKNGSDYQFIQDGGAGSVRPDTASRNFSERLSSLTFTYYDTNGNELVTNFQNAQSVEIATTLSKTVRGQAITSTLTDTATLRNK